MKSSFGTSAAAISLPEDEIEREVHVEQVQNRQGLPSVNSNIDEAQIEQEARVERDAGKLDKQEIIALLEDSFPDAPQPRPSLF